MGDMIINFLDYLYIHKNYPLFDFKRDVTFVVQYLWNISEFTGFVKKYDIFEIEWIITLRFIERGSIIKSNLFKSRLKYLEKLPFKQSKLWELCKQVLKQNSLNFIFAFYWGFHVDYCSDKHSNLKIPSYDNMINIKTIIDNFSN